MSVDAVALRVAIDGVHESMKVLRDLEQKLKDMGPAARKGSSDAQKAMAQLKTSVQDVQRAYSSAAGRIQSTWGGVTSALRGSAVAAASVAAGFAGVLKVVQMFDSKKGFERVLKFNLGEADGARLARQADKFAVSNGLDVDTTRQGVAGLAGTGMKANDILPILEAFTALATTSGADPAGAGRAFTQFTQIASQGKLQGDELRAIQENGVQLIRILKDAGLGDRIGSQKDPITFDEIVVALRQFADRPEAQKAMAEKRSEATSSWQAALSDFRVTFLEPLGEQLAPAVRDVALYLREITKSLDPKSVAQFVKQLISAGISTAKWVAENKDLLLTIGKAIVAMKAFSLVAGVLKDIWTIGKGVVGVFKSLQGAMTAIKALHTLLAGFAPGAASAAGTAAAGAASAGGGVAIAAIASTVGAVLAAGAVGVAAYGLTTMLLDKMGYNEWLADKFGANEPIDIAADKDVAEKWKNRKRESAEEFASRARNEYYGRPDKDAMGRKITYGITRAEQNATFAHMMGRSLR